jgi:hypothetical protein
VGAEQIRAEGKEELLEATSVLEAPAQERDKVLGDVQAAAAFALGERENPGGMFVTTGTGGAVFSDADFFDEGEGAFEGGPEAGELSQKALLELSAGVGFAFHVVCILYYIHTMQGRNERGELFCGLWNSCDPRRY